MSAKRTGNPGKGSHTTGASSNPRHADKGPSRDQQRMAMAGEQMDADSIDVIICRLPHNVLMLSGYSPVLGDSFLVYPRLAEPTLIVPEAEEDLARTASPFNVLTFRALRPEMGATEDAVRPILAEICKDQGLALLVIGIEYSLQSVVSTYTQVGAPSSLTIDMYRSVFPDADIVDASPTLERLGQSKTEREVAHLRVANEIAAFGFHAAREAIHPGASEGQVAGAMAAAILSRGHGYKGVRRVTPFPHVMSGPRSAEAYKAFNMTSDRRLVKGDLVLAQLEVYADGYWAEVTRTFVVGEPSSAIRRMYETCLVAQARAIEAIGYGVKASEVDQAARQYIAEQGYEGLFKHGLGHEVGFQAISHTRPPRLNPHSEDELGPGMTHNVEPSIYVEGMGGIRINDTVLDLPRGAEYLSRFERSLQWAVCD
ncbi:MAG: Xaa-Pro peptidase family protein [Chloroflexi bacterium]|nr:Xaa-Pro peptidase family protein [Chloroflexota bacterium]